MDDKELKRMILKQFDNLVGKRFTFAELLNEISKITYSDIELCQQENEGGLDNELYFDILDEQNPYCGYYEIYYLMDNAGKMYITETYVEFR